LKNDRRLDHAKGYANNRTKATLIASLVARLWRFKSTFIQLKDSSLDIPQIFYPYPIVYELEGDDNFHDCKYLYAEPYIQVKEAFTKYSNNDIFIINDKFGTFSHFSYDLCYKDLVITDLQGFG
jgi:hypothetical protein